MVKLRSLADPELVRLLRSGNIGVIPTDTVYGIAARAADQTAVAALYRAKQREGKPGTVIAADIAQLQTLGINSKQLQYAAHLWPAAVSVVLPVGAQLAYLDQGAGSLAVRVPAAAELQGLLRQTGPLLTSSANMPGQPTATTITQAQDYFGDTVGFYVEGQSGMPSAASTVVRPKEDGTFTVLRPGAIDITKYKERYMTFDEYQKHAITTLIAHPDPLMDKTIMVLGISGEASEIAEKWKKLIAYREGKITAQDKEELGKEIGDVLWYLSVFADMIGLSMDDIASKNAAKLASRKARGVQKGAGDNR